MRRRVFLVFAWLVVSILGALAVTVAVATRSEWGREQIRSYVERTVNRGIRGRLHLGALGGSLFTGLTLDSLELRDRNDSIFIALGRLDVSYDPRDLLDRRILIHRLRLTSLAGNIFEDSVGMFNFRRIFESDAPPGPPPAPGPRRNWGHFIKIEDAIVDSVRFTLTTRWSPSDQLTGAVRDSVIRFTLAREDKEIWRGPGVFYETRRWTRGHIELDSARIDDRQPGGRNFAIRTLSIDESDPPFRFRNARGAIRIQGDSIWADVPHFELPGSRANLKGKIWWGPGQPTRFDLAIRSDSVSLADIAWVYPTLPTDGGGTLDLIIRSESDPRIIDYILSNMDVRSTDSRLRGALTFGVGAPVTIVKDVDLSMQPMDFRLIETLAGEPLPYPWAGTITGTLLASGGPLDNWMVDESDLVFRDANVPGAVTIGQVRGRMNILQPSNVVFNGLNVNLTQLDLRTLQFLVPAFPRLNGQVTGRAILDSLWTDVRFREADLSHTDGSGPATRLLGAGRVTFTETQTLYDVAMLAQPFSFTTFRRAYTEKDIPLKGEYVGPLRLFGTTAELAVTTQLRGPAGQIAYDGRVDGDSLGGFGVDGTFSFAQLDLKTLLDTNVTPATDLWGRATMSVTFDSLLTLAGTTTIDFDRNSRLDSVTVYAGARTRMRFGDGVVHVVEGDTIRSAAGQFVMSGGLGLGAGFRDTMVVDFRLDSLGGWRRYLSGVSARDSLAGTLTAQLRLRGSIDTLGLGGWVEGVALHMPGLSADSIRVTPDLTDLGGAFAGRIGVGASRAALGGVGFSRIDGDVTLQGGRTGDYGVLARATNGPVLHSGGSLRFDGDTTTLAIDSLSIMLDSLSASAGANRFRLAQPSIVRIEPERIVVDSMLLEGRGGEQLRFVANAPDAQPIMARLDIQQIDLDDLSRVLQTRVAFGGSLSGTVDVGGTRQAPRIRASASLDGVTAGGFSVARASLDATYADRRLLGTGRISQADTLVLTVDANWPIDLTLESRETRQLDDTVRVTVRSPDVDLSILESFTPAVRSASGIGRANLELVGPRREARLNGEFSISRGRATLPGMGITVREVHANILARRDTVVIDSLSLVSGPENNDFLNVGGWIAHPLSAENVSFQLTARASEFHAIGLERQLADLYVDADLRWTGTDLNSRATGTVIVQRGSIALPESSDKDLFSIENWDELGIDRLTVERLGMLPRQASRFIAGLTAQDVRVVMGPDVWLRSEDAAIKLTGAVNVEVRRPDDGRSALEDQLVLTGDLQTERGTYRLNVSPLQRTFLVESGRLRFTGNAGFNPDLDIRAVYTSRQIEATYGGRNDVRIGAHITGSLTNPQAYLYSADSLAFLSESDLASYVLFDQPNFSVGGGLRGNTNTAVSLLLGTASSWASSYASRYAGGLVDFVQLQTTSEGQLFGGNLGIGGAFEGAQLGVGKQLSDRMFISATSGLCQVGQVFRQSSGAPSILSSIGVKTEYRFGRTSPAGVSFAYEPSFDKLVCNGVVDVGFTTSKKQVGFDFFRVWRR